MLKKIHIFHFTLRKKGNKTLHVYISLRKKWKHPNTEIYKDLSHIILL